LISGFAHKQDLDRLPNSRVGNPLDMPVGRSEDSCPRPEIHYRLSMLEDELLEASKHWWVMHHLSGMAVGSGIKVLIF
jgi:hypothetical protein